MIQALSLDLDDTLLDNAAAEAAGVAALHAAYAETLPTRAEVLRRWQVAIAATWARFLAGELTFTQVRHARVRAVFARPDLDESACAARFAVFLSAYERAWRCFPDVAPFLAAVRLPIAVVSNARSEQQAAKLRATGLIGRVAYLVTPDIAGAGKPQPAIFHHACRLLGVAPVRCLHVGDHRSEDIAGALDAGLRACWIDRAGDGAAPAGAAQVRTLGEIPALLMTDLPASGPRGCR